MIQVENDLTENTMNKHALVLVFYVFYCVQYSKSSDITNSALGSNTLDVSPAAFGDFNSDELTDLFVFKNNKTHGIVQILLGSIKEPYFNPSPDLQCTVPLKVTSIVPGDYDGDGLMDMLVTVRSDEKNPNIVDIYVHWGEYKAETSSIICSNIKLLSTWDEPLAITYQTDLRTDIFAVDFMGPTRMNITIFRLARDKVLTRSVLPCNRTMKYPHSHAFLDINEDNNADLVLTTEKSIEGWLYVESATGPSFQFDPNFNFSYPNGLKRASTGNTHELNVGQLLFMDLESNDKLYALLPVIRDEKGNEDTSISVYSFEWKKWSRLPITFANPDTKEEWSFVYEYEKKTLFGLSTEQIKPPRYMDIPTLRAGDFDNDGFVDLLATLRCGSKVGTFLFLNKPDSNYEFSRTFEIQWSQLSPNNENAVMGVFFDFLQDGILDVIFVKETEGEKKYLVSAYKNSLDYDTNFIKVMVISGIDDMKVQMKASSILGKKHFYGSNLPGPKIHYKTTNQDGEQQFGRTSQLAQSAHFALNLPYSIFGLGRSPNFVEDLIIGMFNETKTISPVIPNSQLVIRIPNTAAKNPSKWRAQSFVTPSKILLLTAFAFIGICVVLAIVIGFLQWKERREDKMERLQESQRFHFDAM